MSFTDTADNTPTDVNQPPVNPNQQPQEDPLASPQGPQPRRPMNWPNQTLPQLAGQWDPTQSAQDPNNPNAVAPDQTVAAGGFTSGTPGPFQLAAAMPAGPYGPFGPRPFREDPRQRFIPGAPNRPFEEWGTPRRFPVMPQMWEIPGIYSGIGSQLSQWGPGYVQPFAAMMGQGSGAWMRGYMRGQAALTNQQYQQMRMAAYQTEHRMQEVASEYGQIMATFGDGQHPEQLKAALRNAALKFHDQHMLEALDLGVGNAETLARWYETKHGDLHVSNRQLEAAEAAREKDNEYKRDGQRTGNSGVPITPSQQEGGAAQPAAPTPAPPAAGAGGGATEPGTGEDLPPGSGWGDDAPAAPAAPSLSKEPPAAQAPDARGTKYPQVASADPNFVPQPQDVDKPAEGDQAGEQGDQLGGLPRVAETATPTGAARTPAAESAPAAPTAPAAPRPSAQAQPRRYSPEEQREYNAGYDPDKIKVDAEKFLVDGKLDFKTKGTQVEGLIRQRANEMQRGLDALQDPNSKLTGDALVERIKQISPRYGAWVEMMRKGQLPMGRGGPAQFTKGPMGTILALAMKAEPGMDLNRFQQRAAFQRWLTVGQGANQLIRLGTAYGHSKATLERLQNMPMRLRLMLQNVGTEPKSGMIAKGIGAAMDTLDPEAARSLGQIQTDLRTLAGEYMAIMAMTGAGSMTEREGIRESLDWSHPQRAMGQINEMMERIKDREGALRQNAVRAGMSYNEIIKNIGSGAPPQEGMDPAAGAAGMQQMEHDRGGGYQDVPGHPGVRMRQVP